MPTSSQDYLASRRQLGYSDDQIVDELVKAGWTREQAWQHVKPADAMTINSVSQKQTGATPSRAKLVLIIIGYIIVFAFLSFTAVAIGYAGLVGVALGGDGDMFYIAAAAVLILAVLIYVGIRTFIPFAKKYAQPRSRVVVFFSITLILLPFLTFVLSLAFQRIYTQKEVAKINTQVEECKQLFSDVFSVKEITNEYHTPGTKYIVIEAVAEVSKPVDVSPSALLYDDSGKKLFRLDWLDNAEKGYSNTSIRLEPGEQPIKLVLVLEQDPQNSQFVKWIGTKSFTISNVDFFIRNNELCAFPGGDYSAPVAYTTHEYTVGDFISKREAMIGKQGYSFRWGDGRDKIYITPSVGSTAGGYTVVIDGLYGIGNPYPLKGAFFGDNEALSVTVSAKQIILGVPPGKTGKTDIWLVPEQYAATKIIDAFTYQ